jgi:uncharacterized repeat protein (TIGR01451 family)
VPHRRLLRRTLFLVLLTVWIGQARAAYAQETWTALPTLSTALDTGEKPQSKVWFHAHTWWAALPTTSAISPDGTWVFRLEPDNTWTPVFRLSGDKGRADVKAVGDVTHVLIVSSSSTLVSLEYVPSQHTYQLWSQRTSATELFAGETATIDVDSTGRMWLATDSGSDVEAYYSDSPYSSFSGPITLSTNIGSDDIAGVIALPNDTIGVLWSNQNTEQFQFRVHVDGANPATWQAVETLPTPDSRTADDHLNMAVAADGTLYAAIKTSNGSGTQPNIGLYVRRPHSSGPGGTWDNLYFVDSDLGTRPIVILNEDTHTVRVFYTPTSGGDLYFRESDASAISFGPRHTLMNGGLNNVTSTKDGWAGRVVVLADGSGTEGVLFTSVPGLVGYWKMNEGAGTKARDMSGWGNDAAIVGTPAWGPGFEGLALNLNQSNYALVSDQTGLDPVTGLTLAAWIRPEVQAAQDVISKAMTGSVNGYSLSLSPPNSPVSPGTVFVRFNQATFGETYRLDSLTQYPFSGGTWMHIAATYDGTTMRLYINGFEENSMAGPAAIGANTLGLGIGAQSNGTNRFRGGIDDVRIYNRALSAAEVGALMGGGGSLQADLAITKSDSLSTVSPGQLITYTIQATNFGPDDVPSVTISDILPSSLTGVTWTCTPSGGSSCSASGAGNITDPAVLPAGGSVLYTLQATVASGASGTISNTATIQAASVDDPVGGNNSATDVDTVQQSDSAPQITTQPASVTVTEPTGVLFEVSATGTAPLSYEWRRDGTPITGATSSAYVLDPTMASDSGTEFDVVVTNPLGSVTSAPATLTVLPSGSGSGGGALIDAQFDGGADAFTYADDLFRSTHEPDFADGAWMAGAGFTGGALQVQVGGVNSSTIEHMSGGWQRGFVLASSGAAVLSFRYQLTQTPEYEPEEFTQMLVSLDGVLYGFPPADYIAQVVGEGPTSTGWQFVQVDFGTLPAGAHVLAFGAYNNHKTRYNESAQVFVDDVLLTANTGPSAPSITTPPASVTVTEPAGATFSVTATGDAPLGYQWRRDGISIDGATGSSYVLASTSVGDSGAEFDVIVTNGVGSATSAAAVLTVNAPPQPPSITTPPADATVTAPDGATFSVTAAGDPPLGYQWWRNGMVIGGATGPSYTLTPTNVADSGSQFFVVVSNGGGSVTSPAATLTVNPGPVPPSITAQPANATVTAPDGATFTVGAAGDLPLSYQWRRDETPIGGATGPSYVLASTSVADNGAEFDVVVTNGAGSVTSAKATLTVNAAPSLPNIVTQPSDVTVTAPTAATFTVVATGGGPVDPFVVASASNTVSGPGAAGVSVTHGFTLANGDILYAFVFSADDPGSWGSTSGGTWSKLAEASDSGGADRIGAVLRRVVTNAAAEPASYTFVNPGGSNVKMAVMIVQVRGGDTTTPEDATTTSSIAQNDFTPDNADSATSTTGALLLAVHFAVNSNGFLDTKAAGAPAGFTLIGSTLGTAGSGNDIFGEAAFRAETTAGAQVIGAWTGAPNDSTAEYITFAVAVKPGAGGAPLDYQWWRDGAPIAGATSSSYTIPSTSLADSGAQFEVVVTNEAGSVTSATATLTVNGAPQPPTIVTQPASATVTAPDAATFTVAATGESPLGYQWRRDGAPIAGATGSSYTLLSTSVEDDGAEFDVIVTNGAGEATSATATLNVNPAGGGGGPTTLIDVHFDAGPDGFAYVDDPFRGTNAPGYANGAWIASGGFSGGGLRVDVGGLDSSTIVGMSGGWQRSFSLAAPAQVVLSFRYRLTETAEYETDEFSQVLVGVDGVLYGIPPADYIAQVVGGGPTTTGWQVAQVNLGTLPAGTHTLSIGGFNNQKTRYNEAAEVVIDDVLVTY